MAGFRAELSSCHQPPSHQEQVAEREQGEEMRAVLGEAPVAGLHVTELALDDAEGMLDLGPDHRDAPIDLRVERVQWATLRGLAHDTPDLAWTPERGLAFGADITLVRPDRGFLAVQKLIPDLAVMQLGGRGVEAVRHTAVHIHADVRFHAEIPVVALLCR